MTSEQVLTLCKEYQVWAKKNQGIESLTKEKSLNMKKTKIENKRY